MQKKKKFFHIHVHVLYQVKTFCIWVLVFPIKMIHESLVLVWRMIILFAILDRFLHFNWHWIIKPKSDEVGSYGVFGQTSEKAVILVILSECWGMVASWEMTIIHANIFLHFWWQIIWPFHNWTRTNSELKLGWKLQVCLQMWNKLGS